MYESYPYSNTDGTIRHSVLIYVTISRCDKN